MKPLIKLPLIILFTLTPWLFNPYENWIFELPKARLLYTSTVLIIILTLWMRKKVHTSRLLWITLIYLSILFITGVVLSPNVSQSFWGTYTRQLGYIAYLQLLIFPFFLAEIIELVGSRDLYKMITWGSFGTSVLALSQYTAYSPFAPVETYGFRLYGSFGEPNLLGYYLVLTLFPLWQLFKEASWKSITKYFYLLTLLLSSYTVIDTGSRGAMIALGASIILLVLHYSKTLFQKYGKTTLIISALLLITGIGIVTHQLADRHSFVNLRILNNVTVAIRLQIWQTTIAAANESWLWGHGVENLAPVFEHKAPTLVSLLHDPNETIDRAHNDAIDHYFSGGIIGLAAYFLLIGASFYYSYQLWRKRNMLIPFGLVLQFFIISSLGPINSSHMIFLALALALLHLEQKQKSIPINSGIRLLLTVAGLILISYHIETIIRDWR